MLTDAGGVEWPELRSKSCGATSAVGFMTAINSTVVGQCRSRRRTLAEKRGRGPGSHRRLPGAALGRRRVPRGRRLRRALHCRCHGPGGEVAVKP